MDEEEFHKRQTSHLKTVPASYQDKIDEFKKMSTYVSGQYDSDEDFAKLNKHLEEIESKYKNDGNSEERNRVFYMALPPSVFTEVAEKLKKNCYSTTGQNRIIVEKPFGKDLQSSRDMMAELKKQWREDEVGCRHFSLIFIVHVRKCQLLTNGYDSSFHLFLSFTPYTRSFLPRLVFVMNCTSYRIPHTAYRIPHNRRSSESTTT
jgi:hypothetical protein